MQGLSERRITAHRDTLDIVSSDTNRDCWPSMGTPVAPALGRRRPGEGISALGLVLLGTLALTGCASQRASRAVPFTSDLTAGNTRTEEEQVCAAQRSGATVSAACLRERQVAQTTSAAGSSDPPQPEREQRSDILKTASDIVHLLSDTEGVAKAVTQWRTAVGP
jgi:hypothetical protein